MEEEGEIWSYTFLLLVLVSHSNADTKMTWSHVFNDMFLMTEILLGDIQVWGTTEAELSYTNQGRKEEDSR